MDMNDTRGLKRVEEEKIENPSHYTLFNLSNNSLQ